MPIIIRLDVMLARRKITSREWASQIGIAELYVSTLKSGRARGFLFGTLEAICKVLDCQPGDILEYVPEPPEADGG